MARPRVFISSTCYDLKDIRASMEDFVKSLGFDPILSERGDVPYDPKDAPDKSCYAEVESADMFVLIIGRRYGSKASDSPDGDEDKFYSRYDSVTKKEYETAFAKGIPVYTLIKREVYSEHETYLANRGNKKVKYVHAASENVFLLIDTIKSQSNNNAFQTFDNFSDIQDWLRGQWAGRFHDLLKEKSNRAEIAALAEQVRSLSDISTTLKAYLERMMQGVDGGKELVNAEEERLREANIRREIMNTTIIRIFEGMFGVNTDTSIAAIRQASSMQEVVERLSPGPSYLQYWNSKVVSDNRHHQELLNDINRVRELLNLPPFDDRPPDATTLISTSPKPPRPTESARPNLRDVRRKVR